MKLKITTVGSSAGVILPKELLLKLRAQKGDELYVREVPGGIALSHYDPDFAEQMAVAEEIMHERRNLLRKLADS